MPTTLSIIDRGSSAAVPIFGVARAISLLVARADAIEIEAFDIRSDLTWGLQPAPITTDPSEEKRIAARNPTFHKTSDAKHFREAHITVYVSIGGGEAPSR